MPLLDEVTVFDGLTRTAAMESETEIAGEKQIGREPDGLHTADGEL